jgi:hypothetical protein
VTIATNLPSIGQIFATRCDAIRDLIKERVSLGQVEIGLRPLSAGPAPKATKFPCVFVEAEDWPEELNTNIKYDYWGTVYLYCAVQGNSIETVKRDSLEFLGALAKLFSNNALDDRLTPTPSFRYYAYAGNWIESRFRGKSLPVIPWQKDRSGSYLGRVIATFRFHDVLVH